MNKIFEKEYRNKIQDEMPDLWSRIEEGLIEKKEEKKVFEFPAKTGRSKILKYSGFAAACICLAIVLPVFIFTEKKYGDKSSSTGIIESAENMEFDALSDADGSATEEPAIAEGPAIAAEEELAIAEEPAAEELAAEETTELSEAAPEEMAAEDAGAIETKYMKVSIHGHTQSESSFLYEMIVEEDNNDEFESGTEIEMEADESFVTNLEHGKRYEIEFYYDPMKSVPYRLTGATEIK